jgi:SET domain-containing protein
VFASREVTKGEVLERCWVMPISVEEAVASKSLPTLNRYLFPWVDGQRCMLSGEGLLYNFASREVTGRDPNAECAIRRGISAIEFRALRNIREGDEITWDYKKAMTRIH